MSRLIIDLKALQYNFKTLKKACSNEFFVPMVKANAYGHGLVEVCKSLDHLKANYFGVFKVSEALMLKKHSVKTKALVFHCFDKKDLKICVDQNFSVVISSFHQLNILKSLSPSKVKVHLKFNTGMNRMGFDLLESKKLKKFLSLNKWLKLEAVATHFASSYDAGKRGSLTLKQSNLFETVLEDFPKDIYTHALNSEALKMSQKYDYLKKYGARPGIGIYGQSSCTSNSFKPYNLKPVLSLKTQVVLYRYLKKGEKVSYSHLWEAKRPSLIAVIPLGYGHGFRPKKGFVLFRGERCPLVGQICMDYAMVDLTKLKQNKNLKVGEEVLILGKQKKTERSLKDLCAEFENSAYEILTSWSSHLDKEFKS